MDRMIPTYKAIFIDNSGNSYHAEVILSPVTISIIYYINNERKEVYWLAERILSMEKHANETIVLYRHQNQIAENLIISDPALLEDLAGTYRRFPFAGAKRKPASAGRRILIFLSSVLAFIALIYFFLLPWIAGKIAANVSREWEVSLGENVFSTLAEQYKIDSSRTILINQYYKTLQYNTSYPIYITVVKEKLLNAYALPGGRIVVYDELLGKMNKSEELAALIAHEVSHVENRHSLKSMARSLARRMFLQLLTGGNSGLASVIVDNADNLKHLEYSRSLETEADMEGMKMMMTAGIDPAGMASLMEILQAGSTGQEPSTLLSTHPVFENRIKGIKALLASGSIHPQQNVVRDQLFHQLQSDFREGSW